MKVTRYEHGDPDMYRLLGRYFSDRGVHKEMGGPLYSTDGTSWFVATERGKVLGFCSMRNTPSAVWFDYAYVKQPRRGNGVFRALSEARDASAVELGKPAKICMREERWGKGHYETRGWSITSRRGSWIYAERPTP